LADAEEKHVKSREKAKCRNGKSGFYCVDIFNSNYKIAVCWNVFE
jgi:hypothetical protein